MSTPKSTPTTDSLPVINADEDPVNANWLRRLRPDRTPPSEPDKTDEEGDEKA